MGRVITTHTAPGAAVAEAYAYASGLDIDLFMAVWEEERTLYGGNGTSPAALNLAHLAYIAEVKRAYG